MPSNTQQPIENSIDWRSENTMSEFRSRVLAPLSVPLMALAAAGVFVFCISRVLLAVPKYWSTSLAMLLASEVLGVAAVIAVVRKVSSAQKMLIGLLGAMVLVGGGIGFASGIRPIESHGTAITIAAKDSIFDVETLTVPADEEFVLEFSNNDANIPHNVGIYADDTFSESIWVGEVFNGVATVAYDVTPIPSGEYAFRCDIHPDMKGSVVADGEGGHGEGSETEGEPHASGDAIAVSADSFVFSTDVIEVHAGEATTIEFANNDANIPHNIAIYEDDTFSSALFAGEVFKGIATEKYSFTIEEPGSYPFRCDLHPTMLGTVEAT